MDKWLFKQVDNTGLVLWRVAFGLLIAIEGYGAIATGWVRRTLVEPEFTFNFIGLEFLQPLPGDGMYYYFALMGTLGVLVMLGYKYRFSMAMYAIMWSCVYLMQKSAYNNHYYLMMILCWLMVFLPANRYLSLDARLNPKIRSLSVPRWAYLVPIGLIWIVYTYASVAKIYPDWLDGTATRLFMAPKKDYALIGPFLQQDWVHMAMAYFGILFDLLIVPMLLWRRTRFLGFAISLFFHLFNSVVFRIGIFPYMSIAFSFFFFSPELLIRRFLPWKPAYEGDETVVPSYKPLLIGVFSVFFMVMIALPLRHWFFKGPVLWNEEGHRLAWRMMLRTRSGQIIFYVTDKETGEKKRYPHEDLLTTKQQRGVKTKPDFIWQLAQRIHALELAEGRDVKVTVISRVRVNDRNYSDFIDPEVDLASVPWEHFKHHDWILPPPEGFVKHQPAEKEEK
jgi:hypothetical protein